MCSQRGSRYLHEPLHELHLRDALADVRQLERDQGVSACYCSQGALAAGLAGATGAAVCTAGAVAELVMSMSVLPAW